MPVCRILFFSGHSEAVSQMRLRQSKYPLCNKGFTNGMIQAFHSQIGTSILWICTTGRNRRSQPKHPLSIKYLRTNNQTQESQNAEPNNSFHKCTSILDYRKTLLHHPPVYITGFGTETDSYLI